MKKSFDHITNGWMYRTAKTVGDVVIISALFLVFCLPVITIGASASALYYAVYRKYQKKSDEITKDFIRALKENLKHGIIIHLIYTVYTAIAGFNIYFALFGFNGLKLPEWYTVIAFLPAIPVIFSFPYVYPLVARFSNSVKETVKNSFTLCMISFPKFLLIWLIFILALVISVAFPPSALLTPVGATYLIQMITEKTFESAINMTRSRNESEETENGVMENE